jgi:hypothetical protein
MSWIGSAIDVVATVAVAVLAALTVASSVLRRLVPSRADHRHPPFCTAAAAAHGATAPEQEVPRCSSATS